MNDKAREKLEPYKEPVNGDDPVDLSDVVEECSIMKEGEDQNWAREKLVSSILETDDRETVKNRDPNDVHLEMLGIQRDHLWFRFSHKMLGGENYCGTKRMPVFLRRGMTITEVAKNLRKAADALEENDNLRWAFDDDSAPVDGDYTEVEKAFLLFSYESEIDPSVRDVLHRIKDRCPVCGAFEVDGHMFHRKDCRVLAVLNEDAENGSFRSTPISHHEYKPGERIVIQKTVTEGELEMLQA